MKKQIQEMLKNILSELGVTDVDPVVEISDDPIHGEYTSNIAMRVAKLLKKSPVDIALQVAKLVTSYKLLVTREEQDQNTVQEHQKSSPQIPANNVLQDIDRVEVVAPGFINFFLTEAKLSSRVGEVLNHSKHDRTSHLMVEFAHPNTHKAFHIGHLRNITTGESIVRLLESQGNKVTRVNYQGDVGMHIAKCLYGILQNKGFEEIKKKSINEKIEFLGKAYALGSKAFEDPSADGEQAKKEIGEINKQIYAKDPAIMPLYEETRKWSLDYFDSIYKRVGTHFNRLYFESEVFETGKHVVMEGVKKGIFKESDGAIIFPGEKHGLHNRVFITSEGNATYEGKELGLSQLESTEFGELDRIIHVVGPEQASFFEVTFKAEELLGFIKPGVQKHLVYGWVKLKHGKMSSRSGVVVLGEWLLEEAKKEIYNILQNNKSNYTKEEQEEIAETGAIAAVKYAFLRVSTKQEIAFDLKESVSFDGDSGPYLLYTYARAQSVLRKAANETTNNEAASLNSEERNVARLLHFYPEVVESAAANYAPNVLCTYLFKLAQAFNLFYQKHQIVGNDFRFALTKSTAQVLKNGLYLLGIDTVERM